MKMGLERMTIVYDPAGLGIKTIEDLAPSDIYQRFFSGRSAKYYACEHGHLLYGEVIQQG
ncbi:MAG: hypothetical protein PHE26_06450 [Syntrophomonadaceae bacterium]|nr:hypothetical protein [Syntrophomonadaceae bacterium]